MSDEIDDLSRAWPDGFSVFTSPLLGGVWLEYDGGGDDVAGVRLPDGPMSEAALSARSTPAVKPLQWHEEHGCTAKGLGILYAMGEGAPGLFALYSPFCTDGERSKGEVQAIAQADYERRILSALL